MRQAELLDVMGRADAVVNTSSLIPDFIKLMVKKAKSSEKVLQIKAK